jgi:hypothetical protein
LAVLNGSLVPFKYISEVLSVAVAEKGYHFGGPAWATLPLLKITVLSRTPEPKPHLARVSEVLTGVSFLL